MTDLINEDEPFDEQRWFACPPGSEFSGIGGDGGVGGHQVVLAADDVDGYLQADVSAADLVATGFDAGTVCKVIHLVDRAERKRRQYPPGTKITEKAFGRDRRVPILSKWYGD